MNLLKKKFKQPISVLVVIYDSRNNILLLERSDKSNFWQSVTGSIENDETIFDTAKREVLEETGIQLSNDQLIDMRQEVTYEIYEHWKHRYAPEVKFNKEHLFSAQIESNMKITISNEHTKFKWFPYQEAINKVFSPSNKNAILNIINNENI